MKVLTASQMREVDRKTIERGIPSIILMENAGNRVVEFLESQFAPLSSHRIAVFCGKGNNGGDGLVIARQLYTRLHPRGLHVILASDPGEFRADAATNWKMLEACGCKAEYEIVPEARRATLVIDALLGTGLQGEAEGRTLEFIREINANFGSAKIVAVDIPSGLGSDSNTSPGESVRADYTVTFTAPKVSQVLSPTCERVGQLSVARIGSPPELYESDPSIYLSMVERTRFQHLFAPRTRNSNKGAYGHVLVIAGSRGKTGAAAMTGIAVLRAGAGLVTVASPDSAIATIASHAAELMTEPLAETGGGFLSSQCLDQLTNIVKKKSVVAIGPGLGTHAETVNAIRELVNAVPIPVVVDADALNAIAGTPFTMQAMRILTPHPGEMARLTKKKVAEIQANRVGTARDFAMERGVVMVLKGDRTLIAFPDGRVHVNPTGSPALATGGTGDVLTGLIAGLLAQFPAEPEPAILAAVYLHGRAGELGAVALGEKALIATDLFQFLPEAMRECTPSLSGQL